MRETYRLKVMDKHGQAQVGADILIDYFDAKKLRSLFGTLEMAGLLSEGVYATVEKPGVTPYSVDDYQDAEKKNLDLDDWTDYQIYYELGDPTEEE